MKINSFTKTYANKVVLSIPDVELDSSKIYAVVGANGSGKSTLGKILSGIIPADGKHLPVEKYIRVGYMPQKSFAFRMSLEKNIGLTSSNAEMMNCLIDKLGLSNLKKENAKKLSGGETAKMALARILSNQYDLLILDEPTAAMDMKSTIASEKLIQEYLDNNKCIVILITHSIQQAKRIADNIIFLKDGMLVESGEKNTCINKPKTKELKEFLNFYSS